AGGLRKVDDAMALVDQHARRRQLLQSQPMLGRIVAFGAPIGRQRQRRLVYARAGYHSRQWRQLAGSPQGLEDARLSIHRAEQLAVYRLGRTHEQISVPPQRIVERAADLVLQLAVEIDQKVAAGDQVDMRERWVSQKTVGGEHDEITDFATNT